MTTPPTRLLAVLAAALFVLAACGDSSDSGGGDTGGAGGAIDCDLGNEITADFDEITGSGDTPTQAQFEALLAKIESWSVPDDVAAEVETVKDGLGVFIAEFEKGAGADRQAIEDAGASVSEAGRTIETFLTDNC